MVGGGEGLTPLPALPHENSYEEANMVSAIVGMVNDLIPAMSSNGLPIDKRVGLVTVRLMFNKFWVRLLEPVTLTGNYDAFWYTLVVGDKCEIVDLATGQAHAGSLDECLATLMVWAY